MGKKTTAIPDMTDPIEVVDQHPIKCDIEVALGDKSLMPYNNHKLLERGDGWVKTEGPEGRIYYIYGTFVLRIVS